ncbi:hypothetical protein, partial [Helicobacter ganmani]|uniref:hypothetical protein n=1 Tax=Helicobacter ganmani TaxID=60246 RepID=UPI003A8901BA
MRKNPKNKKGTKGIARANELMLGKYLRISRTKSAKLAPKKIAKIPFPPSADPSVPKTIISPSPKTPLRVKLPTKSRKKLP